MTEQELLLATLNQNIERFEKAVKDRSAKYADVEKALKRLSNLITSYPDENFKMAAYVPDEFDDNPPEKNEIEHAKTELEERLNELLNASVQKKTGNQVKEEPKKKQAGVVEKFLAEKAREEAAAKAKAEAESVAEGSKATENSFGESGDVPAAPPMDSDIPSAPFDIPASPVAQPFPPKKEGQPTVGDQIKASDLPAPNEKLLAEIRGGYKLKKVELVKKPDQQAAGLQGALAQDLQKYRKVVANEESEEEEQSWDGEAEIGSPKTASKQATQPSAQPQTPSDAELAALEKQCETAFNFEKSKDRLEILNSLVGVSTDAINEISKMEARLSTERELYKSRKPKKTSEYQKQLADHLAKYNSIIQQIKDVIKADKEKAAKLPQKPEEVPVQSQPPSDAAAEPTSPEEIAVNPADWERAKEYFKDNPDAIKFRRKKSGLKNSFIKASNGKIYAMAGQQQYVGRGSFGKFKVCLDEDGGKYGVKISAHAPSAEETQIMKEMGFLLGHADRRLPENQELFKGKLQDKGAPQIVSTKHYDIMPLKGKELYKLLVDPGSNFSDKDKRMIMLQSCSAIFKMHQKGILHCDIKPENFTADVIGGKIERIAAIDFGFSKKIRKQPYILNWESGTPGYMSPEIAQKDSFARYSFDSDIYALGNMMASNLKIDGYDSMLSEAPEDRPPLASVMMALCYDLLKDKNLTKKERDEVESILREAQAALAASKISVIARALKVAAKDGRLEVVRDILTIPAIKASINILQEALAQPMLNDAIKAELDKSLEAQALFADVGPDDAGIPPPPSWLPGEIPPPPDEPPPASPAQEHEAPLPHSAPVAEVVQPEVVAPQSSQPQPPTQEQAKQDEGANPEIQFIWNQFFDNILPGSALEKISMMEAFPTGGKVEGIRYESFVKIDLNTLAEKYGMPVEDLKEAIESTMEKFDRNEFNEDYSITETNEFVLFGKKGFNNKEFFDSFKKELDAQRVAVVGKRREDPFGEDFYFSQDDDTSIPPPPSYDPDYIPPPPALKDDDMEPPPPPAMEADEVPPPPDELPPPPPPLTENVHTAEVYSGLIKALNKAKNKAPKGSELEFSYEKIILQLEKQQKENPEQQINGEDALFEATGDARKELENSEQNLQKFEVGIKALVKDKNLKLPKFEEEPNRFAEGVKTAGYFIGNSLWFLGRTLSFAVAPLITVSLDLGYPFYLMYKGDFFSRKESGEPLFGDLTRKFIFDVPWWPLHKPELIQGESEERSALDPDELRAVLVNIGTGTEHLQEKTNKIHFQGDVTQFLGKLNDLNPDSNFELTPDAIRKMGELRKEYKEAIEENRGIEFVVSIGSKTAEAGSLLGKMNKLLERHYNRLAEIFPSEHLKTPTQKALFASFKAELQDALGESLEAIESVVQKYDFRVRVYRQFSGEAIDTVTLPGFSKLQKATEGLREEDRSVQELRAGIKDLENLLKNEMQTRKGFGRLRTTPAINDIEKMLKVLKQEYTKLMREEFVKHQVDTNVSQPGEPAVSKPTFGSPKVFFEDLGLKGETFTKDDFLKAFKNKFKQEYSEALIKERTKKPDYEDKDNKLMEDVQARIFNNLDLKFQEKFKDIVAMLNNPSFKNELIVLTKETALELEIPPSPEEIPPPPEVPVPEIAESRIIIDNIRTKLLSNKTGVLHYAAKISRANSEIRRTYSLISEKLKAYENAVNTYENALMDKTKEKQYATAKEALESTMKSAIGISFDKIISQEFLPETQREFAEERIANQIEKLKRNNKDLSAQELQSFFATDFAADIAADIPLPPPASPPEEIYEARAAMSTRPIVGTDRLEERSVAIDVIKTRDPYFQALSREKSSAENDMNIKSNEIERLKAKDDRSAMKQLWDWSKKVGMISAYVISIVGWPAIGYSLFKDKKGGRFWNNEYDLNYMNIDRLNPQYKTAMKRYEDSTDNLKSYLKTRDSLLEKLFSHEKLKGYNTRAELEQLSATNEEGEKLGGVVDLVLAKAQEAMDKGETLSEAEQVKFINEMVAKIPEKAKERLTRADHAKKLASDRLAAHIAKIKKPPELLPLDPSQAKTEKAMLEDPFEKARNALNSLRGPIKDFVFIMQENLDEQQKANKGPDVVQAVMAAYNKAPGDKAEFIEAFENVFGKPGNSEAQLAFSKQLGPSGEDIIKRIITDVREARSAEKPKVTFSYNNVQDKAASSPSSLSEGTKPAAKGTQKPPPPAGPRPKPKSSSS